MGLGTRIVTWFKTSRSARNTVIAVALTALLLPFGNACSRMELSSGVLSELELASGSNDSLFRYQWNITNYGQVGGTSGEDARILPVWRNGNHGENALVAVVDDGLEIGHADIAGNVKSGSSHNYNTDTADPSGPEALHGTCVAGIIAGVGGNGFGISGVAPSAQIIGYNFLESNVNVTETDAMTRNMDTVSVYNNSWGPGPGGHGLFRPSPSTWRAAIETGLTSGRDGKGSVYVFAAGNGAVSAAGEASDNSNLNGYANFYGVTAICAVDEFGEVALYSEPGANVWVCAPSGSGVQTRPAVTTTDITGALYGYNIANTVSDMSDRAYTSRFSGTSAAAPLVSGVVALMLSERPALGWRDVKWILAKTARKNDAANTGWQTNGANMNISYDYGFGVVDAEAAVDLAKTWTPVGPMKTVSAPASAQAVGQAIPDDGTVINSSVTVSASGITKLEFVEVTINMTHQDWGNLVIQLERSGNYTTISRLTVNHKCLDDNEAEADCDVTGNTFRFGTARHLGEAADGTWTIRIVDADNPDSKTGTFTSWQMRLFGE